MRIFFTSDLHLGMKLASYDDAVRQRLVDARFETLERLVSMANESGADLLVVAGDLFDRVGVSKKDVTRASQALSAFEGRLAAVLPGNHDYAVPDGSDLWRSFGEAASGDVLVLDEPRAYPLASHELDCVLYPCPCTAKHSRANALGWIGSAPRDRTAAFHVGVAHGSVEGVSPDFDGAYYPMTRSELEALGLDLWLLGHTHVPYPAVPDRGHRVFFAGTPEPDGFDCAHGGTAWLLELVAGEEPCARAVSTGRYRFAHDSVEVGSEQDLARLQARYDGDPWPRTLLKLELRGRLPREAHAALGALREELESKVLWLQLDEGRLGRLLTRADIDRELTAGSFPHRLLTKLAESEGDLEALQEAHRLVCEVRR